MTTEKIKPARAELEAIARAFVNNTAGDYDTRRALAEALREGNRSDEALALMIEQAEAGELISTPFDDIEKDYRALAHAALRYMDSEACPMWLLSAMQDAVDAAAAAQGLEVWREIPPALRGEDEDEGEGYSARALGDLFRVADTFTFDLVPRPTLAEHIAAVLADENTPTAIYDALAAGMNDLTKKDTVTNRPEVIRVALDVYAEEKGGE